MDYLSIITFFAGYIISEIIRRMNRAENFNTQIFNKRLDIFSELYCIWNNTYENVSNFFHDILDNKFTSDIDLHEEQLRIVEPLLKFLDEKALFFSQELCVQCGAAFLRPDEYTEETCQKYLELIQEQNKIVTKMIRDESGLTMLNKNIKGIIGYRHKSELITYFKRIKKK